MFEHEKGLQSTKSLQRE